MLDELAQRTVLIDTNLVVLLASNGIAFKNTNRFGVDDYKLLRQPLAPAATLVTLAYVVAETSNLAAQGGGRRDARLLTLTALVRQWAEGTVACRDAVAHAMYPSLGATDAAILTWLAHNSQAWLLTTDARLYAVAGRSGLNAINFNHVRDARH